MQVKNLYVKGSIHSIVPLEEYNRIAYRVIADDGMAVTLNGTNLYPAIDVDSADGWYEVMSPEDSDIEGVISELEAQYD